MVTVVANRCLLREGVETRDVHIYLSFYKEINTNQVLKMQLKYLNSVYGGFAFDVSQI